MKIIFSDLYAKERFKEGDKELVHRLLNGSLEFDWEWKTKTLKLDIIDNLSELEEMIKLYPFKEEDDTWVWRGNETSLFSIASCMSWMN